MLLTFTYSRAEGAAVGALVLLLVVARTAALQLPAVLSAAWGARVAFWANDIGMGISNDHPQNAVKVPRHLVQEGFALREGDADLMSADWWWSQPLTHKLSKAGYSCFWYAERTLF